jgi:hypothetical protein
MMMKQKQMFLFLPHLLGTHQISLNFFAFEMLQDEC